MTNLHFIWYSKRNFGKGEFYSLLSALKNTTYDVFLHTDQGECIYDPRALLSKYPKLRIIETKFDTKLNGQELHPAFVSDIYRLKILTEYGGIYSDLDVLWLRDLPFEINDKLNCFWENEAYKIIQNAVIIAPKGFSFQEYLTMLDEISKKKSIEVKGTKSYIVFVRAFSKYVKQQTDVVMHKKVHFYKNGWRKIQRVMEGIGELNFDGSSGFHWYNSLCNLDVLLDKSAILKQKVSVLIENEPKV